MNALTLWIWKYIRNKMIFFESAILNECYYFIPSQIKTQLQLNSSLQVIVCRQQTFFFPDLNFKLFTIQINSIACASKHWVRNRHWSVSTDKIPHLNRGYNVTNVKYHKTVAVSNGFKQYLSRLNRNHFSLLVINKII